MLRVLTPLTPETEALVERVIGCCITVHRALGPGLLESIYSRAIGLELDVAGISFEREKQIAVHYRDQLLCYHRLDILVESALILEVKCVERLNAVHHAQLLNYLRLSHVRVGLLVNFNVALLRDGLRRMLL